MTRVALFGATGRMGRAIINVLAEDPSASLGAAFAAPGDPALGQDAGTLAGLPPLGVAVTEASDAGAGSDELDVAIDFTSPEGTARAVRFCRDAALPLVSGTTGLPAAVDAELTELSESQPVLHAPNMSVGVTLLFHLAELAARGVGDEFDLEIVEMHHRNKVDAPSGTAVRLAERVAAGRGLDASAAVVHGRSGQVGARSKDEIGVMTLRGGSVVGEHTLILAGPGERLELTHRAADRSIFARGAVRAASWLLGRSPGRYGMEDVLGIRAQR